MTPLDKRTTAERRKAARRAPILIVEDNVDQWHLIRETLANGFPEVEPIWINHPVEVLPYLEKAALKEADLPRLILLDLFLPSREGGFALLQAIKSHPLHQQIPVVVWSHSQDEADIVRSYNFSIASYIVKPASVEAWQSCISIFRRYWVEVVHLPLPWLKAAGYRGNRLRG